MDDGTDSFGFDFSNFQELCRGCGSSLPWSIMHVVMLLFSGVLIFNNKTCEQRCLLLRFPVNTEAKLLLRRSNSSRYQSRARDEFCAIRHSLFQHALLLVSRRWW